MLAAPSDAAPRSANPAGSAPEVIIVGAGPAGLLLAWTLVRGGQPVHIVERHPDFGREFRGEGIQASVVRHLEELGLLEELLERGIAVRAEAARVYLDEKPVAVLRGSGAQHDFGIILHQERFLAFLHERLSTSDLYRASFGVKVEGFLHDEGGRVVGVAGRQAGGSFTARGAYGVVTAGRGSPLRKAAGLEARPVDTHFNILWLRLPRPRDEALVPQGFRAYLSGDSLFILYSTADGGLQLAWGRRDEEGLKERSFARKKARLLAEAPPSYRAWLDEVFDENTRTQFLNVRSDRLTRWHQPGLLFLGDAAHTMSPVAGQGINLAMRDSLVAARHLLDAKATGAWDDVGPRVQAEREDEVVRMQRFQRGLGYFMLGAPRWQVRAFFSLALPLLDVIGLRSRFLDQVQNGVTRVAVPLLPPARFVAATLALGFLL